MKYFFPFLLLLIFSCSTVPVNENIKSEPLPYGEDEFSPGLIKLRRAEILLFGSLPLFYMMSSVAYDMIITEPPNTDSQLVQKMTISFSLSTLLALSDFIVGEIDGKEKKND